MNTTPDNHHVAQKIRMGHVGAALRSSAAPWQPRSNCPPSASEQRNQTTASEIKHPMMAIEANLKHALPSPRGRAIRSHRDGLPAATMCCEARPYRAHAHLQAFSARPAFGQLGMISRTTLNTHVSRPGAVRQKEGDSRIAPTLLLSSAYPVEEQR